MYSKKYKLIAKTLHNLEDVLASELNALGAEDIELGRRSVSFVGDKAMLYKANLRLRTALRILKPVYQFRAKNADELYEALLQFKWESIMRVEQSFAIDTTVFSDVFTHSKYVGYRAKDAIVDYWRQKSHTRPNVSLDAPDIYLNIHIAQNEVTLSLDSSGESLHKRGYRDTQTDAPINEVLAAGILLKAGWDGSTDLIDPMCGSGTFLIEAALIARNIAPGIYRKSFAFEQWTDYDADLFESLYNDDSEELIFENKIYGSDILAHAIRVSDSNIRRAGVSRDIRLDIMDFAERPQTEKPALIVMNPPYGERLRLSSPESLYAMIGERLKHNYPGCKAWIIAYKTEHFDNIGLRQSSRLELMNGSLPCELRSYELFAGKREDFKKQKHNTDNANKRAERKARFTKSNETGTSFDRPKNRRLIEGNLEDNGRERRTSSQRQDRSPKPRANQGDKRFDKFKREEKKFSPRSERPQNKATDNKRAEPSSSKAQASQGQKPKRGLWPSDRFAANGSKPRGRNIQVFRKEE